MEKNQNFEIERKYLFKEMPAGLEGYRHIEIEQGYISTVPVVRIRKKITHPGNADTVSDVTKSYVLTIKSSGMLSRQEYEMDITDDEYVNLSKKVEGNLISKTRYVIPLKDITNGDSGLTLELDKFQGAFEGLVMAEIEFPNQKSADSYETADIFSDKFSNVFCREVTYDKRFHNSTMSSMSQGEIQDFIRSLGDN
jgi:CYTH domain-containing protein